jgi:hypothetical protein
MQCNLPSKALLFLQETGNKEPDDSRTFEILPVSRERGRGCIVFSRIPTPVFVTLTVALLSQSVAMNK